MDSEDDRRAGIQSLDAAIRVLNEMAHATGPLTLTELAGGVAMPLSKVHRYLSSFVAAGLVRQSRRSGRYDLGVGAVRLGLAALSRHDVVEQAGERLDELAEATGAAALLAIWGPAGATVVRWHRAASFVVTSLGLGTTLPLLNSATGRVYFAFSPPRVVAGHLASELARAQRLGLRWPDLDPARPESLAALRERVRRERQAAVDGRFIPGLSAVAAPVCNWQGEAEVVITLVAADGSLLANEGEAARRLYETCEELSQTAPVRPATPGTGSGPHRAGTP